MRLPFITPAPERRLLDESKRAKSMSWVMAIMLFLTVLAAATGLGMANAAQSLGDQLAGRLTIQVIEADPKVRDKEAAQIADALKQVRGVTAIKPVDQAQLAKLLQPWLGDAGVDPSLPMPAMIDIDLSDNSDATMQRVQQAVLAIAPKAQVDRHSRWLSPVQQFVATLGWLALALVLLMATATGAVVLLAARTGLDTHRSTIDVLHMLGATDRQVARLFQRRIAIDTFIGGAIGAIAAAATVLLLQWQIEMLNSDLMSSALLGRTAWIIIALLPILFTILAMIAARIAVLRTLGKIL